MRIAINLPEFHQIPKAGHITNHSKAESTVQPAIMLHYSTTLSLLMFCFVDMKLIYCGILFLRQF